MTEQRLPFVPDGRPGSRLTQLLGLALSLGWLAFPIVDFVDSEPSAGRAVAVGATLAAWLAVYLTFSLRPRPSTDAALWWIAPLAAVAVVLALADGVSWAILLIYCAASSGLALRSDALAAACVGACALLCGLVVLAVEGETVPAITLAGTTVAVGGLMFAFGRVVRANYALREAREQLAERAVDEERLRFARDLHDLLGRDLSVITLKAQLARRLLAADPATAGRELADVEAVARTALSEVREAVSGYRQPTLAAELAGARSALDAAGIACEVRRPEVALPPSREAVLAWGVREATTNVLRHSGAQTCAIRIAVADDVAHLEVTDDGGVAGSGRGTGHAGGDAGTGLAGANGAAGGGRGVGGSGLGGLRERALAFQGSVEAGPRPGGGFALELHVPLGPAT